jgi:hypothetical protein
VDAGAFAMTSLCPERRKPQRPQAVGFAGCNGTPTGVFAIQMCHEKMHLFSALVVVRISKFAPQYRRNNFLFMRLARYINRK